MVYAPGPEASVSITVAASTLTTVVDEPVVLYASRRTGGYVQIPNAELPAGVRWWRQLPPAYEEEVAANLKWIVKPEGKARFNTDLRKDFTREVRFTQPGTYSIHGVSSLYVPEPVTSPVLTIQVLE